MTLLSADGPSDPQAQPDRSLTERIRAGDQEAAAELYERYAKQLFGLVRNQMADYLRARMEPDDIVQSVFKSVFRNLNSGNYDAPEGGTLWHLFAVIAVHKVRRKAKMQAAARRDDRRNVFLDWPSALELADRETPEQLECALRETIEVLCESDRATVLLRVQGYSVEEISERTQRSRRSVERSLQRARQTLGELLLDAE